MRPRVIVSAHGPARHVLPGRLDILGALSVE